MIWYVRRKGVEERVLYLLQQMYVKLSLYLCALELGSIYACVDLSVMGI